MRLFTLLSAFVFAACGGPLDIESTAAGLADQPGVVCESHRADNVTSPLVYEQLCYNFNTPEDPDQVAYEYYACQPPPLVTCSPGG